MGELIRLAALHLFDPDSAELEFQVKLTTKRPQFNYTKPVFNAVLRYFGELIDGNIMQYLCENQPLIILTILFKAMGQLYQREDTTVENDIFAYLYQFH
ncbi:unnamed protein product [Colias eurytheme]|nr:unnamed protein product [Colias eurytheme]